jgi:hypothetical protein
VDQSKNVSSVRKRIKKFLGFYALALGIPLVLLHSAKAETIVRDRFIVLSDPSDVANYLKNSFPQSAKNLVPATDSRYTRAESILENVWQAYRQHKPHLTADLPRPQIILLKAEHIDAYIATDPKTKLFPHAVFIFTRTLEMPDNEVAGLLGHELTHLLNAEFTPKYYLASETQEPLGFLQGNDTKVEAAVKQLQSITEVVGPYFIPELNGLPAPIVYDGQLFNFFLLMALQWGDSTNSACQIVMNPIPSWRLDLLVKYVSPIDQKVRMTETQAAKLDQDSKTYIAAMYACLGTRQEKLIPTLSKLLHESEESLKEKYQHVAPIFDAEPNIVAGVFSVANSEYKRLREVQSQNSLAGIRVYSHEEFADDEAVRVLKLTKYNPASLGQFFLSLMEDMQPHSRETCEAILASGKVPPYGLVTDPHHAACFRVYHVRQLVKALQ